MKQAFIKLHLSIILAGFTGVFGKLITLNEGLLVWYRLLFASLLLFMILFASHKLKPMSWKERFNICSSGILLALHWVFFYGSIKYANVSVGVVCFALTSFFTALAEPIINKKRASVAELFLSSLTLVGIALIFHFDTRYRVGILLGVVSSMFIAVFTVINEKLNKRYDSDTLMLHHFSGGWLGITLLMPLYLWLLPVETLLPSLQDLSYMILFVTFCTILMYRLINQSLQFIPAFTVNLSFNLEPLYTIALAMLFFHEQREFTVVFYIGLGFIFISVLLQTWRLHIEHKRATSD